MNCLEQYLVELLQHHITYESKEVQVVKNFNQAPRIPVITLDLSPGISTNYIHHDVTNAETLYYHRTATININVWCNTERERESINNQILQCYYTEKTFNYTYCSNYDDRTCTPLSSRCKAITTESIPTSKGKCPDPTLYGYESLQSKYYITNGTLLFEPPFDMDEYDRNPPLLRSIIRCTCDYEEPVITVGNVEDMIDDITWGDVEIVTDEDLITEDETQEDDDDDNITNDDEDDEDDVVIVN